MPGINVASGYCSMSRNSVEFGMFPSLAVAGLATYRSALNIESPTCNIPNISLTVGKRKETCDQTFESWMI